MAIAESEKLDAGTVCAADTKRIPIGGLHAVANIRNQDEAREALEWQAS